MRYAKPELLVLDEALHAILTEDKQEPFLEGDESGPAYEVDE